MKLSTKAQADISRMIAEATERDLDGNRADLLDRYNAEPYGDEVKGKSAYVSTDVADAVEAIHTDIMDVFTSQQDLLVFAPVGQEDEIAAKQETDTVSHIFWQKCNGFVVLYTWVKEALMQQNAYVWRGWVEKERVEIEEYEDLTYEELLGIFNDIEGEYEILESAGFEVVEDELGGETIVPTSDEISLKCRIVTKEKRYEIEPFPQEDFFCTPRWSKLDLEGIPCAGRRHRGKRIEDWVAFGFKRSSLEKLSEGVETEDEDARFNTQDNEEEEADDNVEVYESYCLIDPEGNDKLRLLQIWGSRDGSQVLKWADGTDAIEEVSHIPISSLTPWMMPHRHVGRSATEQVDDIQRVKTVLMRHSFDSVYATNYARPYFDDAMASEHTFNDLLNPNPGAPVRTGGAEINWFSPPSVIGSTLPLIEMMDAAKENRIGSTRYNQGLDAESLNKTATGVTKIMNAGQKKNKLVARTIAETALRDLFLGIHRDLRSGPMKEITLRLRGTWAQVDPRTWKHRTDMVPNIGLGSGDRDEIRAGLTMLGQVQRELMASGSRMVDEQELWNTIDRVAETFGINNLEQYLKNPATLGPKPPAPPPPPDPMVIAAQSDAQKKIADAQRDAAKIQADERERERKHTEAMAKLRLEELRLTNQIQTDEERIALDKNKAVMSDDLERDKLKAQENAASAPPIGYEQVTEN